ncbi:hypothetical protein MVEN_01785600 [Mycena venus]|uniref:Uncharacterized protein n=1 Tax=Mycena venus TaxID=2733690 RepID=A0A8H6XK58_9AGAR|nr:hypothetical protein MVEN_01785600 [Mycena venus]
MSLTDAVLTQLDSPNFSFSFHAPPVNSEVWSSVQNASDAVCEEFALIGENVLGTCFLCLTVKPKSRLEIARNVARSNGFLTTIRDAVLSPPVYAALVSKTGLQWPGPSVRTASDAFLIFVAALHASLHDTFVLAWFHETFLPLIRAAADTYDGTSANAGNLVNQETTLDRHTYAPVLEILAQIKIIQSCHSISSSASLRTQLQKLHQASQLLWGTATFTGTVLSLVSTAISPVMRLVRNTVRDSIPASWRRSRKLSEALEREKTTKRRVSSIMDPRPTSRVGLNTVKDEAENEKTEIDSEFAPPPRPSAAASKIGSPRRPSAFHGSQVHASLSSNSLSPSSNVLRPWQYTRAVSASPSVGPNASPNAKALAPAPLRLPRRASLGYNPFDDGSSSNAHQAPNLDLSRPRRGRESF